MEKTEIRKIKYEDGGRERERERVGTHTYTHRGGLILNKKRIGKKSGLLRAGKPDGIASRPADILKHSNRSDGEKPPEDKDIYRFRVEGLYLSQSLLLLE